MVNLTEYVKLETSAGLTAISLSVMSYCNIGETDTVATLMEMACSLSEIGMKIVLGEATDEELDMWTQIVKDIREGL